MSWSPRSGSAVVSTLDVGLTHRQMLGPHPGFVRCRTARCSTASVVKPASIDWWTPSTIVSRPTGCSDRSSARISRANG